MCSEIIGTDHVLRVTKTDKFNNGNDIIDKLPAQRIINVNSGQPTMWLKDDNDSIHEYHVDTSWINDELGNHGHINRTFHPDTTNTDHYPNHRQSNT